MEESRLFAREDEFIRDCEELARRALRPLSAAAEVCVFLAVFEHRPPYVGDVRLHPPVRDPAPYAGLRELLRVWERGRDLGPVCHFDAQAFLEGDYSVSLAESAPEEAARMFGDGERVAAAASVEFVRHDFVHDADPPDESWFAGALVAQVLLPPEPPPPEPADYAAVDRAALVRHVCQAVLSRGAAALRRYVGTDLGGMLPTPGEVLREGGRRLMDAVAPRGPAVLSGGALMDAFTLISSLPYEKREAVGAMILPLDGAAPPPLALAFEEPIDLHAARAVRKQLEMCRHGLRLVCDGARVLGVVHAADVAPEAVLTVRFTRHHGWELRRGGTLLMGVRYGEPVLPQPQVDRERFRAAYAGRFGGRVEDADRLWEVVEAAMRQPNGALLVISPDAAREAERLEASSTRVRPAPLDDALVLAATNIDGAVLLSPDGACHAVGVILDGRASPELGSGHRGARYNQTLRYLNTAPGTLAVVVSEDGDVELL
ncbi:MAG TPA: diadenylate cyclase [Longimicrobium sp.]|nr:diadenylate cyclase [Longimicrobium sp.]